MVLKKLILVSLLLMSTFHIFSAPVMDSGLKCEVSGKISSVEFKEKYKHPCVNGTSPCPVGSIILEKPERYKIDVEINTIKTIKAPRVNITCREYYPQNSTKVFEIPTSKITNLSTIEINNSINASFTRGISNMPNSYTITSIGNNDTNTSQQNTSGSTNSNNNSKSTEPFFNKILSWIQSIF